MIGGPLPGKGRETYANLQEDWMVEDMFRTYSPKQGEIEREWFVVDAAGQTLGRISSQIARVLTGKHKPQYAPHQDTGDFVIVINAEKVKLTGRKLEQKTYYRHSGYMGHLKWKTAGEVLAGPHADRVVRSAVRGMLPKNALGRQLVRKLKVYAGPDHPHAAQKPEVLTLD